MIQVKKVILGQGQRIDSHSRCETSSSFHHPRTLILGFSKGGTVVNQLITELGTSGISNVGSTENDDINLVPKTKEAFLNSITEIHYVDVGLNSTGAYLTDRDVIERVSERLIKGSTGVRFMLHGTPRQWRDSRRGWICSEKDTLVRLLESEAHKSGGKLQVYEKYYFADRPPDLQMHFEIIEVLDVNP